MPHERYEAPGTRAYEVSSTVDLLDCRFQAREMENAITLQGGI